MTAVGRPESTRRATWVLTLGVASLPLSMVFLAGLPVAVTALCLAPGARREIRDAGGRVQGQGRIRTGVICSWVTLGLGVLALLFLAALVSSDWSLDPAIRL